MVIIDWIMFLLTRYWHLLEINLTVNCLPPDVLVKYRITALVPSSKSVAWICGDVNRVFTEVLSLMLNVYIGSVKYGRLSFMSTTSTDTRTELGRPDKQTVIVQLHSKYQKTLGVWYSGIGVYGNWEST